MKFRSLLLAALGSFAIGLYAGDADVEIEHLIQRVENSGCSYVRNGTEHSAADAADHLRLKHRRGKRYVDTAEHFIDRLASESSWTGKPYQMRCGGRTEPSAVWLHRALDDYREAAPVARQ